MTSPTKLALDVALQREGFDLAVQRTLMLDGITALFGPSGSGKTTLLRVIAGLESGARGAIQFDDIVWQRGTHRMPPHRRGIGYVFQDGRLFPHLNVESNLRFGAERARAQAAGARTVAFDEAVAALDLEPLLPRRPSTLSGGEQQRVAIGRALLTSPRLMLMDEPLSALDIGRKREVVRYIEKLPAAFGVSVLYVTHNIDEVARLATEMVLLEAGRIVAQGSVADILERTDLWALTGSRDAGTILHARVVSARGGGVALSLGTQTLQVPMTDAPAGGALRLRVHARDVAIATVRPQHISIRNVLTAEIVRIDLDATAFAEVLLAVDGQHLRSRITRDALDELALAQGQTVFALLKSVALDGTLLG